MIGFLLLAATSLQAQPGIDPRHIPMGSPLGAMPIVVSPGEPAAELRKPLTEAQWLAQRRALIARSMKQPRMRAIAKWVEENERKEAKREAEAHVTAPDAPPQ